MHPNHDPTTLMTHQMAAESQSRELRREETIQLEDEDDHEDQEAASSTSKHKRGPMGRLATAWERFESWFAE